MNKRKIFNYKKANWDGLNRDLNSVRWDQYLKYNEANSGWVKFKDILFHMINKHIPTITVKDNLQPPWFDNDVFRLCRKKKSISEKNSKKANLHQTIQTFQIVEKNLKI